MAKRPTFSYEAALQLARGYNMTAKHLELVHQAEVKARKVRPIVETIGWVASTTVLQALALELLLKALVHRAGVGVPPTHHLVELFQLLPQGQRDAADARYAARGALTERKTLAEVLAYCDDAFATWRYLHEKPSVECSMGEMMRAFAVLQEGS